MRGLVINRQLSFLYKNIFLISCFLLSANLFSQGFQIPKKPKDAKQSFVYGYTKLLSNKDSIYLNLKLKRYSDSTSTQIVVAIISSTEGENINYLAANWGEKWGIGQAEEDNGVLVLLAKDDRKISIQAGKGTEHVLTDFQSKRIIERVIIPEFKREDYFNGLNKGVDAIFKTLNGEFKETEQHTTDDSDSDFETIFLIVFVIIIVIIVFRGNKNNRGGGKRYRKRDLAGDIFETLIFSNSGRSSGGFGSSSGGSFGGGSFGGGFGGGSFGGGGASGSW